MVEYVVFLTQEEVFMLYTLLSDLSKKFNSPVLKFKKSDVDKAKSVVDSVIYKLGDIIDE